MISAPGLVPSGTCEPAQSSKTRRLSRSREVRVGLSSVPPVSMEGAASSLAGSRAAPSVSTTSQPMLRPRDTTRWSRLRYPAKFDFWSDPPTVKPAFKTASNKSPILTGLPTMWITAMHLSTSSRPREPVCAACRLFAPCSVAASPLGSLAYLSRVRKKACKSAACASAATKEARDCSAFASARCKSAVARATMFSGSAIAIPSR